jgi:hypothetical protein
MARTPPTITCPSCSVEVSSASRRCPECGHWLPTELPSRPPTPDSQRAQGTAQSSAVPRRVPSTVPPHGSAAPKSAPPSIWRATLPWLGVAAAVVLAAFWLRPRGSADPGQAGARSTERAPTAPAASSSADSGSPPAAPGVLDLDAALSRATSRALEWHRDAELVDITLTGVVDGRIPAGGGWTMQMRFGTPPLGKRLGPGARVGTDQILVRVDDRGERSEQVRGPAARSVAPPSCGFDRAWHAMVSSGVPSDQPVTLRFALDKRGERAIWTAQPNASREPTRTLDGSSCAIILRR